MDLARFKTLAEAYGADLRRWPADERAAAEALRDADPAARTALAEADDLDHFLSASRAPAPSAALRERILAAAPKPRRSLLGGFNLWLSGAGLAAAGVAGVIVGVSLAADVVADVRAEAVLAEVLPDDTTDVLPLDLNLSLGPVGGVA